MVFLNEKYPALAKLGEFAEQYIYQDSNTSFIKLGIFGENIVKNIIKLEDIDETYISHDKSQVNRIKLLKREDLLPDEIESILHILRKKRNPAAHDGYENVEEAKVNLELAYKLAVWFMEVYGDYYFEAEPFVMPQEETHFTKENLKKLEVNNYIREIKKIDQELSEITKQKTILAKELNEKEQLREKMDKNVELANEEIEKLEENISKLSQYIDSIKDVINQNDSHISLINERINK